MLLLPGLLPGLGLLALIGPAAAQPVRIAHDQRFPPFAESRDGQSQGLAVDILRAAAERAGIAITLVPVPFDAVQATLTDGRADAVFPLAINPERRLAFDFSAPLLTTGGALFVRAPAPTPPGLAALAGQTITTPRTGPLAGYVQANAPAARLVVTADYDESLRQLIAGQADAAALNFQAGAQIANRLFPGQVTIPATLFLELPLAVAVPRTAQSARQAVLLADLDRGLAAIRADGTWQRITDRWMAR